MGVPISSLPLADALTGAEQYPIVQNGTTKRTTLNASGVAYDPAGTGAVATTVQSKLRESVSVFDFMTATEIQAVQTNTWTTVSDVTAKVQAAITASKGAAGLHFPAGTYKLTSTLVIATNGSSNLKLSGENWNSRLLMATDNTPIFKIAGMGVSIRDMGLVYANIQPAANTNAIAIAPDYMYQCFFENLYCYGAYAFVYTRPISTTYNGDQNVYFSCSFRDIWIQTYSGYGFYANGYNAGVTGNVYSNIYMNGQTPDRGSLTFGTATAAISLGSQDESVFDQINIEATNLTHAIKIDGISGGVVFNSVHIEWCTFSDHVIWLRNSHGISFNGIVFITNTLAANYKALVYVVGNINVAVNGVYENGTVTAGNVLYRFKSDATGAGSSITSQNIKQNTANVLVENNFYSRDILFESVGRTAVPEYDIDIAERTTYSQKAVRVNGRYVFDGLYLGTQSSGANAQIEFVANTDLTNCQGWKLGTITPAGNNDFAVSYSSTQSSYGALSYVDTFVVEAAGPVRAGDDNSRSLGSAAKRWSVVYAATGTINTSDEREKQDIADLDAAEKRAAVALKGLVKKFRFKDAVAAKGDGARIHVGVIAQEVVAAFQAEGLDPMRYAILCYDEWGAEFDGDGNEVRLAGNRYGVRYEELLAFIIAAL